MALIVTAGLLLFVTIRVDTGPGFTLTPGGPRLTEAEMNAPAPDFSFRLVDSDAESSLGRFRGNVVLINFWATWCPPCLDELPDLNELQERYRNRGLTVLTISDEERDALVEFEAVLPLHTVSGYIAVLDSLPNPYRRTLAARPTSYVIDRDGVIREFVLGARDLPTFERMVAPYLREPAPGSPL
jgi:cytochrome c biogenesis protein CcmG, thiol:disulfide interchange protein DsbE